MNYKYLMLIFSVILFSSVVFSYTIGFDYAEVRTTSYPTYLPYQYASYYDTIDLRYGIYGSGISSPVNIVVSPKVYGINLSGQRVFVHNIQTQSFLMQPYGVYTYAYNPMFYFDPAYQVYEVVLDLQSLDGQYYTSTNTYIYASGSSGNNTPPPQTPPSNVVSCDDFSISGFSDIYLQEDKRDYYNIYIVNSINKPLTITSVSITPQNPINLDIENISYPYTISGYQTRSAEVKLFADTVSSNYTGYFDVEVVGKYENLTCSKTYNVRYRINNALLGNNASCNDIKIMDNYFTLSSNESKNVEINIENRSLDYYFEVNDIKIKKPSNSIVTANIRNNLYRIYEDSFKTLNINLRADSTTLYKTENLTLEIEGYLKRDNREDRRCKINQTISVRVSPTSSTQTTNECKDVSIFTRNITQKEGTTESYSKDSGFYILNNSNKKFVITGVNYQDNTSNANILSKAIDYNVYPLSFNSLNFDLITSNITSNSSSKANIFIQGYFENGASCNYSDIKSEFNIAITKEDDMCYNVGIKDSSFKEGNNFITVYNNTAVDFSVNDVISQKNQNTKVNVPVKAFVIPKNSQKTISVGANGIGSFELLLKGQFSNGKSCDYMQTNSGYFSSEGYNFSEKTCNFDFTYPNVKYVSLDSDFVEFTFKNLTNKSGVIKLSATGAVIEDPLINFSAYADISKRVYLKNIKNPKIVLYTVDIYGCPPVSYFTNLYPYSQNIEGDVSFITYTSNISSIEDRLLSSLTLKNNSSRNESVEVKFAGFPNNFTFVTTDEFLSKDIFTFSQHKESILINPNSSKNINFGVIVPSSAENIKYNGYIEVYSSSRLILREAFSIDRTITKEGLVVNTSLEALDLKKNKVLLSFEFENNLDKKRSLYLSFEDENSFSLEGDRTIVIGPNSQVIKSYTVTYQDNPVLKYKLIDTDNSSLAYQGELDLRNVKQEPNFLSGFFSLTDTKGFILGIIIILLIVLIYYFVSYGYKKKAETKKDVLRVKEEPFPVLDKTKQETVVVLEKETSKQITLKQLDEAKS